MIQQLYTECNAIVISLTFDGLKANLAMVKLLGATLPDKPYFNIEGVPQRVVVLMDNCHMLKLIRNNLKLKSIFYNGDEKIEWKYVAKLNEVQVENGLSLAPKVGATHVNFENAIMRVKYAVQVLSLSTANALEFLHQTNTDFENCLATANFFKIVNDSFDIFNSNYVFAKYIYKKPLSSTTYKIFCDRLDDLKKIIVNLEMF